MNCHLYTPPAGSGMYSSKKALTVRVGSPIEVVNNLVAAWASYLNPVFLFIDGDQGGHWELLYSPGVGLLLPEQALLIAVALFAALAGSRRRSSSGTWMAGVGGNPRGYVDPVGSLYAGRQRSASHSGQLA